MHSRTLGRADLALRCGNYKEAAGLAQKIVHADPTNVGALETLAKALWQTGAHEEVLGVVTRLISLNPYEPGYHTLRGAALQCLGRYGDSVRAFNRAQATPESAEAIRDLHSWQAALIREMLVSDPVFRAQYERDPEQACAARGFEFVSERRSERWLAAEADRAALFTRPS